MTWEVDRRTISRGAGGGRVPTVAVSMDKPAPTFTSKAGHQWIFRNGAQAKATVRDFDQPAPTILASADNGDSVFVRRQDGKTYKLTPLGALILQSFREDYPVQGNKSAKYEQIGNAVPPRLAMHVVAALTGIEAA